MRRPETIRRYADLVQSFKTSHAKVWTNCFLLPDAIGGHIAGKRMRFYKDGENLLFLVAEEYCERLYCYTSTLEPFGKNARAVLAGERKPVAADAVERCGNGGAGNPLGPKWERSGFVLRGVYQRMAAGAEKAAAGGPLAAASQTGGGVSVRTSDFARIEDILALWRLCLDPYGAARPDAGELRALMAQGRVRFLTGGDHNELCAAMVSVLRGKKAEIDHVAVHPAFRRRGLARALLADVMQSDLQRGVDAFQLWVDRSNDPAIRLYESFGFEPDGMQSRLFVHGQPR